MIWGGYFLAYTCLVSRSCWNSDFRGSRFLLILDVNIGFDAESKHSNTPITKQYPVPKLPQHFIHLTIDQVFCSAAYQEYTLCWSKTYNTEVRLTQQLEYCSIVADHVKSGAAAIARGPVSIQLAGQYLAAKKHIIHTKAPPLTHKKRDRRQEQYVRIYQWRCQEGLFWNRHITGRKCKYKYKKYTNTNTYLWLPKYWHKNDRE